VEAGLDTGGIYAEASRVSGEEETADELRARLVAMGCRLLALHLRDGFAGLPLPRDQAGVPSYAEKIGPGELEIRWDQPAAQIRRLIRLGRAWTTFRQRRVGILRAAAASDGASSSGHPGRLHGTDVSAGNGSSLRLVTVQPEGKRPMDASDWLRGVRPGTDERLGL
jgi:methionyl-tRNA formyltransferase